MEYITAHGAEENFVTYMSARMSFFREHETEAYLFLEARTNLPAHLARQIQEIYQEFDELNLSICEKELSKHKLRKGVSKEDALSYFSEIQKLYNYHFTDELNDAMSAQQQR